MFPSQFGQEPAIIVCEAVYIEIISVWPAMEIRGLYLLELRDEPNEWHMGEKTTNNVYRFWGNYGDLENALASL